MDSESTFSSSYGCGVIVKLACPRRSDHSSCSCKMAGSPKQTSALFVVCRSDDTDGFVLSEGREKFVVGCATSVVADEGAMVGDCKGESEGGLASGAVIRGGSKGVIAFARSLSIDK